MVLTKSYFDLCFNKTNKSYKRTICHYNYFVKTNFSFQPSLCDSCHDLLLKAISFSGVAIVPVKGNSYRIHFWSANKDKAVSLLKKADLNLKSKQIFIFYYWDDIIKIKDIGFRNIFVK